MHSPARMKAGKEQHLSLGLPASQLMTDSTTQLWEHLTLPLPSHFFQGCPEAHLLVNSRYGQAVSQDEAHGDLTGSTCVRGVGSSWT